MVSAQLQRGMAAGSSQGRKICGQARQKRFIQTRIDGKMLLRKAGYTGGAYREQYEGRTQDIYPVIEFVLYWGDARWRSSRELHQHFRKKKPQADVPAAAW